MMTVTRASQQSTVKPKFISFEGVDGAGKSTHITAVADFLRTHKQTVVVTREPGGTPLGEKLRKLLLNEAMQAETEALLMFAARREHLATVIEPALAAGQWVLTDRFSDASFAYQGGGRGLATAKLCTLEQWVHPNLQPWRTFLFDVPIAVASQRIATHRTERDRFEQEQDSFHERVRQAYRTRALADSARFIVLDGTQEIMTLRAQILAEITDCLRKQTT